MCGRYTLILPLEEVARYLMVRELEVKEPPLAHRYNIAPSQKIPVVAAIPGSHDRRLFLATWGFASGADSLPINARAESVAVRRPFRDAFAGGRCLVPASGFFEWDSVSGEKKKQPHYVRPRDETRNRLMVLAGIASHGRQGATCAIVTRPATGALAKIHDRMPLILAASQLDAWLFGGIEDARAVLHKAALRAEFDLLSYTVSDRVNDVRVDGPELVAPIDSEGA